MSRLTSLQSAGTILTILRFSAIVSSVAGETSFPLYCFCDAC